MPERQLSPGELNTRWSFNHLVGAGEERGWDGEAKGLRRIQVDNKLEFGRQLYRKFGGLYAPPSVLPGMPRGVGLPMWESRSLTTLAAVKLLAAAPTLGAATLQRHQ